VHGSKNIVTKIPMINAPAGEVILSIIFFTFGRIHKGISVPKLPFL
jgi:hypothetical protein